MRKTTCFVLAVVLAALGCSTAPSNAVDGGVAEGGGDGGLPTGVTPADGGGYCCRAEYDVPCEPFCLGGWSATVDGCSNVCRDGDAILVPAAPDHGCATFAFAPDTCLCLSACLPDASTDAAADAPNDASTDASSDAHE